jgi:hypothetical protein
MSIRATCSPLLLAALCAVGCAHSADKTSAAQGPQWERELVVWQQEEVDARTWREDARLKGRFHPKEKDDIQVVFLGPAGEGSPPPEVMWVTIIAHDKARDTFLGVLLNSPNDLKDVQEGDNVLFHGTPRRDERLLNLARALGQSELLMALAPGPSRLGWPRAAPGSYLETLIRGIRHYRQGRFGHVPAGIKACIDTLGPVLEPAAQDVPVDQRQLGHFVLARCLAEQYETLRAVQHFEQALHLNPKEVHARMGLLAELSLLAHLPQEKLPSGTEAQWEQRYLAEVAEARKHIQNVHALRLLDMLFNKQMIEEDPAEDPKAQEKRLRVGVGPFRYKAR